MESWVERALARWPNVPALFGWLALDRRGRWLIRGEPISRPQIIDTLNRNYGCDEHGRWFFQNGPQRGYLQLAYAPLVLWADGEHLRTHTGCGVEAPRAVALDEEGSLLIETEQGPALLADTELDWALARLRQDGHAVDETQLAAALAQPSGADTALQLQYGARRLPVRRLDAAQVPQRYGFVREPQPREGERAVVGGEPE